MNSDYPPKSLADPRVRTRRADKPRPVPLPPALLAKRSEIARVLGVKVDGLSKQLKSLTEEQRKTVFYKVTHDGPVQLSGTGLKPLVDRSSNVTLAIPKADNLDAFTEKLEGVAQANDEVERVPNQSLVRIEDIELGEPKDRLSDELLADYDTLVEQTFVICEIECLALDQGKNQRRMRIAAILKDINNAFANGIHGTLFEHEERDGICRAVIRCTGSMFRTLVEEPHWQRTISWFEPKPEFETFQTVWKDFEFDKLANIIPPDDDAPTVCIIDSGVSSGNPFLSPVTKEDLLKSFLKADPDNPYDETGHGSGVASLAGYYALNLDADAQNTAKVWVAGARILDQSNQIEDRLFSGVLTEVVEEFAPLGVRIFNLSVADLAKKWNQNAKRTQPRTSWTARTIDKLSREHDVVFVVSTGNLLKNQIRDYLQDDVPYPRYLCDDEARVLDPGQAGLALSVGAIAAGTRVASTPDTAIAFSHEPSPFTRSGPGIRNEIKPDLTEVGGNLIRDEAPQWVRSNAATNVVMASHQLSPAAAHNYGTSFAAPRVSHKLAIVLHELKQLGLGQISAPLLKAFLVNSATHRGNLVEVKKHLDAVSRKRWLDVLGHGFPDSTRATDCDDYSILLFRQGELAENQVAFFDIPVPDVLVGSRTTKRITVTVAHYPEVQNWGLESYYGIDLKWRMFRGDKDHDEIVEAMSVDSKASDDEDGDDPPELPKELKFEHGVNLRSRGTLQHDWCDWTEHRKEFSDNHYTLAVAAYSRWGRKVEPTSFGLVVRLEDIGGQIKIYNEVVTKLEALVETESRT